MATMTGRAAAFYGAGKPIEIKEYPVPGRSRARRW